jgi:hypothetical protein
VIPADGNEQELAGFDDHIQNRRAAHQRRKHAILFAATLLSARKIIEVIKNDDAQNMGRKFWMNSFVNKAID